MNILLQDHFHSAVSLWFPVSLPVHTIDKFLLWEKRDQSLELVAISRLGHDVAGKIIVYLKDKFYSETGCFLKPLHILSSKCPWTSSSCGKPTFYKNLCTFRSHKPTGSTQQCWFSLGLPFLFLLSFRLNTDLPLTCMCGLMRISQHWESLLSH